MTAMSISIADRPPEDPGLAAAFYENLLNLVNAEGRDQHGWSGSTILDYGKISGTAFLQLAPGEAFATIDDLRRFREVQRAAREQEIHKPKQGSLV